MSFIQQFFTSRDNNANAETFVGQEGRLWWDPVTNQIYSSDGSTPGGIPLAGGGGGNGTPGGLNGQVQFNQAGNFGGTANLTINTATGALSAVSFVGNGAPLTNITGANVTGTVADATHASVADSANSVAGGNVTGNVANATHAYFADVANSVAGANVTGTVGNATTAVRAGTVTTNAQPNITSVGTLTSITSTGNISTTGNVSGNYFIGNGSLLTGIATSTYGNSNVSAYLASGTNTSNVITTANIRAGNISAVGSIDLGGAISAVGNITGGNLLTGANVSAFGNVTGGNIVTGGVITTVSNVVANYFVGNGAALFAINGSNVTGTVASATTATSATTAGTVTTAAQPNITSVGTLTSITSTGNISTTGNVSGNYFIGNGSLLTGIATSSYGNANVVANLAALGSNPISTTGNVTAGYFIGNGSTLTSITGANVTGTVASATTATSATTAGTVTTAAQPNITSVGTLTSVSVTGNINTVGTLNINSTGGNYNVLNITGTALVPYGGSQTWQFFTQNTALGGPGSWILFPDSSQQTTAYPGTSSTLSLTGNITGANFIGNGYALTSVNGSNVSGAVASATTATTATSATTAGTVTTAAQPNITSVGTLTSVTVTGNVTGGNLLTGGLVSSTGNITSAANISGGNIIGTLVGNLTGTTASLSGNVTAANVVVNTRLFVANGSLSQPSIAFSGDTGADSGFFLLADGNIGVTTNAGTRAIVSDSGMSVIGNITGGNLNTTATVSGGIINATTLISSVGNVIAGNVRTAGLVTATGNVTGGNIITGGLITATGNINAGNLITTGAVYSNYTANTANTGSFMATGGNTKGGTGYLDFLVVQNTSGGATVPYKWLRTTSDGQLQIINSAYTQNIFNLTDTGNLAIPGQLFINGAQTTNGPAFSAYAAAILQTIPNNAQTKVLFQTEEFDTNNCYANSRFTPTAAGYYQLNAEVRIDGSSGTGEMMIILYKNGSEYKRGTNQSGTQIASNFWAMQVSSVAYANGVGDYFEIYVQQGSGSDRTVTAVNNSAITWFNGCMLRGA